MLEELNTEVLTADCVSRKIKPITIPEFACRE
jgi:hypothetical protein